MVHGTVNHTPRATSASALKFNEFFTQKLSTIAVNTLEPYAK
ncbi:hypothetical protein BN3087_170027 [Sulfurovum sp. enrichment culture clone C5]|uniref:Uncharacterized protein n=1 Tax=Sulfurovum sp. enrichment culture clone C5 TaxID=497650 RepID=A0A0S4XL71_9BACT|nr:hypothetical protein BN3087_170027 [Sulfurovum sp. enrichment culture clone C5]